ncbi:hypothetical protein ACVIGB_003132 [Bradyrhizobium sp. USDA 4341]
MKDAAIAPPRRDPEPAADHGRAQQRHPVFRQVLPHREHDAQADAGGVSAQRQALLHREQDLADAEQADDSDEEVDAAQQLGGAKRHAQLPGHRIHADAGKQQPERHRDHGLVLGLAAEADERAEGQEIDGEEFRRAKLQRERRDHRRQEGDQQHRDQRADEGRGERGGQRFGRPALLRHRIAVERGRDRPGFAGDVEQDRGDGAAEQRTPIDAGQHHDGGCRIHREGQRQQDRDAVGAAKSGQHADEDAEHEADHHQQQCLPRQQDGKAMQQETEGFHVSKSCRLAQ